MMLETEKEKLNKYSNPNYWINLKPTKSSKQINRLKKDFEVLLEKHNLLKTKNDILEKLENKFFELIEIKHNQEVA